MKTLLLSTLIISNNKRVLKIVPQEQNWRMYYWRDEWDFEEILDKDKVIKLILGATDIGVILSKKQFYG